MQTPKKKKRALKYIKQTMINRKEKWRNPQMVEDFNILLLVNSRMNTQ